MLLATKNPAKVREYSSLLDGLPFELTTPAREGIDREIEETGTTLEENATLKATTCARLTDLITLADDSGLEVEALGGEPGPLSRRYAGENASDRERNESLLARLSKVPWGRRKARFRCVIAIAAPSEKVQLCQGECQGIIAFGPKGDNGFGYDPIFYLPQKDKTMAELTPEEKNRLSHRGQAALKAREFLKNLAGGSCP